MTPRLKDKYYKTTVENLSKKFQLKNKLMAPKMQKVVLNMGLGNDGNDQKKLKNCIEDMALIAGQQQKLCEIQGFSLNPLSTGL